MKRLRSLFALVLALGLAAAAAAAPGSDLARLEAAAARHPDDPDLAWALARALAEAGRSRAAEQRVSAFVARWPQQRAEAWLWLGRWRYERGEDAAAVEALEHALSLEPSATAHLYLGLALRRQGALEPAERQLRRAAELEPELASETLLLSGLGRLREGDAQAGERLLAEAIARDPEGEAARSARLVLEGRVRPEPRRLRLEAWSGVDFDSNVTLESGDLPGPGSDHEDVRFSWGASARTLQPLGERGALEAGARYDQSAYLELDAYDSQRFLGFLSLHWRVGPRVALRLDGRVDHARLDDAPYLLAEAVRPNLLLGFGERWGVLRLFAEGERLDYHEQPFISSLERGGWRYGGGLEHTGLLPLRPGAWLALGAGYARLDTTARRDLLGFDGAYDHDRWRGSLRSHWPLVWGFEADTSLFLDGELYAHRNVVDALTAGGVGTTDPCKRRDLVLNAGLALTRPVNRWVDLQLVYAYTNRDSNVELYAYDRSVGGLSVRVHTP